VFRPQGLQGRASSRRDGSQSPSPARGLPSGNQRRPPPRSGTVLPPAPPRYGTAHTAPPPRAGPQWPDPRPPFPAAVVRPAHAQWRGRRSAGQCLRLGSAAGRAQRRAREGSGPHRAEPSPAQPSPAQPPLRYGRGVRRPCPLKHGRSLLDSTSPGRCSPPTPLHLSSGAGAASSGRCLPQPCGLPSALGVPRGGAWPFSGPLRRSSASSPAGRPGLPRRSAGHGRRQRCCVESEPPRCD